MKTMEEIPHGKPGHMCKGGCVGYAQGGVITQDATDLADLAASGAPLAADPEMMQAGLNEAEKGEIPEHIKEMIEAVHKERHEARPDEEWRIKPSERPESEVPYKRNEDADPSILDQLRNVKGMADGGVVDPNQGLQDIADLSGAAPFMPTIAEPPEDEGDKWARTIGAQGEGPGPNEMPPAPSAPGNSPAAAPAPKAPAMTDQDFMDRANKMLGLNPQEQAGFMKLLGQNQQKAQIGAALAGVGDAIAAGGTLGKVNPGALKTSEELAQGATKSGIEGMQTIRGNQEKAQELADKLENRDPNSPLSKWAQQQYAGVGKKIGIDLSHASAALISDIAGKGIDALKSEYEADLKKMQLDLQAKTLAATVANQKAEREIAEEGRTSEAAKALANRGYLDTVAGVIPGTAANTAKKVLEAQASKGTFEPGVMAYAEKYGISPEQAQAIKDKRTKG